MDDGLRAAVVQYIFDNSLKHQVYSIRYVVSAPSREVGIAQGPLRRLGTRGGDALWGWRGFNSWHHDLLMNEKGHNSVIEKVSHSPSRSPLIWNAQLMEVGATLPLLVHLCCTTEWHTLTLNDTLKTRPKTDNEGLLGIYNIARPLLADCLSYLS